LSHADIITITHTGTGSGEIGATRFVDAFFTITDIADTANRKQNSTKTGYSIQDISAWIDIAGVGTFDFITPTRSFVKNTTSIAGFARAGVAGPDLADERVAGAFSTWDMLSDIGPISGQVDLLQWNSAPIETSGGTLKFDDGTTTGTFEARVAHVPEPSAVVMLMSAVLIAGGTALKRRRAAQSALRTAASSTDSSA
jgi:hypothetical protein